MTGQTAIEAERELIEVRIQMLTRDPSLVGTQEPPFQQSCDPMDAGQQGGGRLAAPAYHTAPVSIAIVRQAWEIPVPYDLSSPAEQ